MKRRGQSIKNAILRQMHEFAVSAWRADGDTYSRCEEPTLSHRQAAMQTRRLLPDGRGCSSNAAAAQDPAGGSVIPERAFQIASVVATLGQSAASATVLGGAHGTPVLVPPPEEPVIPAAAAFALSSPVGAHVTVQLPSCHSPGHADGHVDVRSRLSSPHGPASTRKSLTPVICGTQTADATATSALDTAVKAAVAVLTDSTCTSKSTPSRQDHSLTSVEIPLTCARAIAAPSCATLATATEECAGLSQISADALLVADSVTAAAATSDVVACDTSSVCGTADMPNGPGRASESAAPEEVIVMATAAEGLAGHAGDSADAQMVAGSVAAAGATSDAVAGGTSDSSVCGSESADMPNGRPMDFAAPVEVVLLAHEPGPVCKPSWATAPAHSLFSSGARARDSAGVHLGRAPLRPGLDGARAPGMRCDDLGSVAAITGASSAASLVAHAASSMFPTTGCSPASATHGSASGAVPPTDVLVAVCRRGASQHFSEVVWADWFTPGTLAPSSSSISHLVGLVGLVSCPAPPQHWPASDESECLVCTVHRGAASIWMVAPLKALCAAPEGSAARCLGDTWMTAQSRWDMSRLLLTRNGVMQYAPRCMVSVDFTKMPPAVRWKQAAPTHAPAAAAPTHDAG